MESKKPTIHLGFTIVELLVVIVVIGILAAITIVAYNGIQGRAVAASLQSDLHNASIIIETKNVDNGQYPVDVPAELKTSANIVLQLTSTGSPNSYCLNAYSTKDPTLRMSWDSSRGGLQTMLCNGPTIGSSAGGTVPTAARGQNLMNNFSRWTLSGGASYDATTKTLTMPPAGVAQSPVTRVDQPGGNISVGGDFYATTASLYSGFTPQAGYLITIAYFGSDGVTPAINAAGYAGNGCAQPFPVNAWSLADHRCVFGGGPNVVYSSFMLYGSDNSGYSSPDLKIKNPLMIGLD